MRDGCVGEWPEHTMPAALRGSMATDLSLGDQRPKRRTIKIA